MAAPTASLPLVATLPAHRVSTSGLVLAVASALAFSSSGPFVKPLLEAGWSLGAALLVRMGVAGLILSPALVRAMYRQRGFLRRHWRIILALRAHPGARLPAVLLLGHAADAGRRRPADPVPRAGHARRRSSGCGRARPRPRSCSGARLSRSSASFWSSTSRARRSICSAHCSPSRRPSACASTS